MNLCFPAPKPGYSQGVTSYTQSQQTRQVTVIKPAAPSPASSTFSIYPVTSTVQPAAASVVPSYSQSPTYSTNAVTYSGKQSIVKTLKLVIHSLQPQSITSNDLKTVVLAQWCFANISMLTCSKRQCYHASFLQVV